MRIATPEEMVEYGKSIGEQYDYILLIGELWAGKTHFTKGFAMAKGIHPDEIQSPTYVYMHEHNWLLHMDMYRIEDPTLLVEKWMLEKIDQYPSVIIEWPRFTEQYTDSNRKTVTIEKISPTEREVSINDELVIINE